jgi:hypothetical protein
MNNIKKFAENMTLLSDIHNKEISKTIADAYFEILKPYSDEQCLKTFKKLIATSKFFPKPADFIEILEEAKVLTHCSAWAEVMKGLNNNKIPDNPKIQKIIAVLGGWDNLSLQSYDELVWVEKRFIEYFNDMIDKDQGLLEAQNPQSIDLLTDVLKNI